MSEIEAVKKSACDAIDKEAAVLNGVSEKIWDFKELRFEEKQSHAFLTQFLEDRGFQVQRSIALETAFLATWECPGQQTSSGTKPNVAFLCEYDALPDIGHACGHNLIAEVGIGAALGVKAALEKRGLPLGKLTVIGTPAEEGGGGKLPLIKAAVFDDVDVAMMVHPAPFSDSRPIFLAAKALSFTFYGKPSHAAGFPWDGVNALDGAVQAYVSIATLRQQIKPTCRIHVIITKGGTRTNIIPCEAEVKVQFRADNDADFEDLEVKIRRCFKCAAETTGCELTIDDSLAAYQCLITNETLARLYDKNAESVGFHPHTPYPQKVLGSTDMGNVSHVVPGLHPTYDCNTDALNHTQEFADAAGSPEAQGPTLSQAKILARIALDIFLEPSILETIRNDFEEDKKSF